MKVVKKGREQKGWSQECKCTGAGNGGGGCGATLLVEEHDLFKTTSQARDETTTYVTFACCECGVLTDIESSDGRSVVPRHVFAKLKTRNPSSSSRSDGVR